MNKWTTGLNSGIALCATITDRYTLSIPLSHRKVQTVFLVVMREVDVRVAPTCSTYVLHSEWTICAEGRQ